jgi:hypothetical protein
MTEVIGTKFVNIDLHGNEVQQAIAPSANTNGLYIRSHMQSAGAGGNTQLYVSTSAPSSASDTTKMILFAHAEANNAGSWGQLAYPIFVPAGLGIWFGGTNGGSIRMTYDLNS